MSIGALDREVADPMIGREVIGQYRVEKRLGIGGAGAVYLARQVSVGRSAVIKVLRSQLGGRSDGAARFAVEARAASSLNHPNIVTIYNYGAMEDGTLFLAMEYIEGETLAQRIARCGPLEPARAVHVAIAAVILTSSRCLTSGSPSSTTRASRRWAASSARRGT